MDGHRFDRWTKTLSAGVNRRQTVKGFAAGALAGVLGGMAGVRPAEAGVQRLCCRYDCGAGDFRRRCVNKQITECPQVYDADGRRCAFFPPRVVNNCGECPRT